MTARTDAAARVRALHPPLRTLLDALREERGEPRVEPELAAPQQVEPPAPPAEPQAGDRLGTALARAAAEPGDDADDLALRLAVAAEDVVLAAASNGAKAARAAGVPDGGDVGGYAVDAVIGVLQPYAAALVAASEPLAPPAGLLNRVRGVARSAGVVEAVRGRAGWRAVQRFGPPHCPRLGCFGHDGRTLTDEVVTAEGLPPYDGDCNCRADAAHAT
jgi:hypothetical protein